MHCEAKTCTHQTAARSWAKHREVVLENPEELRYAQEQKQSTVETYQLKSSSVGTSTPSNTLPTGNDLSWIGAPGFPMHDIWHFAMESAKREAEICRRRSAVRGHAAQAMWRNNLIGEVSRRNVLLAPQDRLTYFPIAALSSRRIPCREFRSCG
jgi:hypothetical protein